MTKGFIAGFREGLKIEKPKKKRKKSGKLSERERKVLSALGDKYGL